MTAFSSAIHRYEDSNPQSGDYLQGRRDTDAEARYRRSQRNHVAKQIMKIAGTGLVIGAVGLVAEIGLSRDAHVQQTSVEQIAPTAEQITQQAHQGEALERAAQERAAEK